MYCRWKGAMGSGQWKSFNVLPRWKRAMGSTPSRHCLTARGSGHWGFFKKPPKSSAQWTVEIL